MNKYHSETTTCPLRLWEPSFRRSARAVLIPQSRVVGGKFGDPVAYIYGTSTAGFRETVGVTVTSYMTSTSC
jgi:hypothetical protein